MADGIAVALPGEVPFGLIRDHVASVDTVSEELISHAMLLLAERAKLVVEPSGAAGVAALLEEPGIFEGPVVAILSGGNVDPLVLLRSIRHGMRAVRRYLKARVIVTDTPVRWPRCWSSWPPPGPTSSTSPTRARPPTSPSARSR